MFELPSTTLILVQPMDSNGYIQIKHFQGDKNR